MLGDVILIRFQNISCYCLTGTAVVTETVRRISKHLMLLFNSDHMSYLTIPLIISKHLMLLFNFIIDMKKARPSQNFKTSHVIV